MRHKPNNRAKPGKMRMGAAAAVFASGLSIGGCGAAHVCKAKYEGAEVHRCKGALTNHEKAKEKLEKLRGELVEKVRRALKNKVDAGGDYPRELDEFNRCIGKIKELSREVERFQGAGGLIKRGKVSKQEMGRIEENMERVITGLQRVEWKLEDLLRKTMLKG
ncbi:MAG: hypothetical protein ACLFUZ_01620 [Candidatus Micrarchaeia archaeon]